jgi:hypothetical protein
MMSSNQTLSTSFAVRQASAQPGACTADLELNSIELTVSQKDHQGGSFKRSTMKNLFKRIPWFYILFTVYPLLFLWTVNVSEIYPSTVIRPFLFTLIGSVVLYAILYIAFRNIERAALIGTLILIAFFSYGHAYYDARNVPALKILSHHSTLIPLYIVVFGLGIGGILFLIKKYENVVRYSNVVSLVLVVIQVGQLSYAYVGTFYAARQPVTLQSGLTVTTNRRDLPDIYFIVLDSYMRADAMQQDLGFDNTPFINQLEQMGFYVARCSRLNYDFTRASIAATLNMKYIPNADENDVFGSTFWTIIKNNEVRRQLESAGYKTVSFQGDYPWVVFDDADVLLAVNRPAIDSKYIYPFEAMYIQSTATIILKAMDSNGKISQYFNVDSSSQKTSSLDLSGLGLDNRDLVREHVTSQLFILDKLPDVPAIAGTKFVYAHIFIPHYPYVLGPDGQIMTDPGFYGADRGDAVNDEYQKQGYINQVQYINKRIIPILQTIVNESKTPPIIVLMGDHGLRDNNRFTGLNAYFLPKGYGKLYASITPVNSFRLIFGEYFGADYPLLSDISYASDTLTVNETYADCIP